MVRVRRGKGDKDRVVPLGDKARRGDRSPGCPRAAGAAQPGDDALFVNARGRRLTRALGAALRRLATRTRRRAQDPSARAAPLLRDPPARLGRRPALDPGAARPRVAQDDGALRARRLRVPRMTQYSTIHPRATRSRRRRNDSMQNSRDDHPVGAARRQGRRRRRRAGHARQHRHEGERAARCGACTTARSIAGFAGSAADGIALFERLEGKLKEASGNLHARRRRAGQGVAHRSRAAPARGDARRRRRASAPSSLSGTGDVIEPDGGVVAIGSGGPYALAAARALVETTTLCAARDRRARAQDRRRDLHLHQPATSRSRSCRCRCEIPRALTPRAIVEELDRYIVGQRAAKRAVAIALRNRWRRQQVAPELRDEIAPKNIIMIGPTGVGKTEIARRLAKLVPAPFLKVEASKFTEVGYVGRDVDSIVRDLVEISVKLVKDEEQAKVRARAREAAEEKLLDLLLPRPRRAHAAAGRAADPAAGVDGRPAAARSARRATSCASCCAPASSTTARSRSTSPSRSTACSRSSRRRAWIRSASTSASCSRCSAGAARAAQAAQGQGPAGARAAHRRRGGQAHRHGQGHDRGGAPRRAVAASSSSTRSTRSPARARGGSGGPDVSREGVQRDLLPIVEGSTVTTKYGVVQDRSRAVHRRRRVPRRQAVATSSPSCRGASRSASSSSRWPATTSCAS